MGQAAGLLLGELRPAHWDDLSRQARFVTVNWARGDDDNRRIIYQQGWPITDKVTGGGWGRPWGAVAKGQSDGRDTCSSCQACTRCTC